ncbi:MAG: hypothetical protein ACXQTE_04515 [Methanosarcinaceae archaeon]
MWDVELTPIEKFLEEEREILGNAFSGSLLLNAIKKGNIEYNNHLHTMDRIFLNLYAHSFRHSFIHRKEVHFYYPAEKIELFALFALEAFLSHTQWMPYCFYIGRSIQLLE